LRRARVAARRGAADPRCGLRPLPPARPGRESRRARAAGANAEARHRTAQLKGGPRVSVARGPGPGAEGAGGGRGFGGRESNPAAGWTWQPRESERRRGAA
jgi:hypothetical protein